MYIYTIDIRLPGDAVGFGQSGTAFISSHTWTKHLDDDSYLVTVFVCYILAVRLKYLSLQHDIYHYMTLSYLAARLTI